MRTMKPALLGSLLLLVVTAAWAAPMGPAVPAPVDPALSAPAALAPAASPDVAEAAPLSGDLFTPAPQPVLNLCPPEPVVTCNSCFLLGQTLSYQCTLFCSNGVPHRSCTYCGSGCPL